MSKFTLAPKPKSSIRIETKQSKLRIWCEICKLEREVDLSKGGTVASHRSFFDTEHKNRKTWINGKLIKCPRKQ